MPCAAFAFADSTRRTLLWSLSSLALGAFCPHAHSVPGAELRAVTAGDSQAIAQVVAALRVKYPSMVHGHDVRALSQRRGPAVYLALGPGALATVLDSGPQWPVVSLFTSSQTYERTFAASPERARLRKQTTAIFADASVRSQFELIREIFQRRVVVGVLLSDATAPLETALRKVATRVGVELLVRRMALEGHPARELNALSAATVILAVPDASIYTQENLRNIIESCYRRGQPIIGFSPSMVTAGTLATAYAAVEDVVAQLDDVLSEIERDRIPEPQYPIYWRVQLNAQVARSLNIVLDESVQKLGNSPVRSAR